MIIKTASFIFQSGIQEGNILRFVDADSSNVLSVNHRFNFIEIVELVKKKKELQAGKILFS